LFPDAEYATENQCIITNIQNKSNHELYKFFICPNSANVKHVCDFAQLPFDRWYRNITIFKSSCDKCSARSAWNNKTVLSGCDRTWQDMFIKKQRFCNLTSKEILAIAQGHGLIQPTSLQVLICMIGLAAICVNVVVLINSLKNLKQVYINLTKVQRVHHILLINLATADFCMGVYVLSVAAIAIHYNDPDGRVQVMKRMGHYCTFLGVFNLVSSQMSVTLLVMITTFRLHSVVRPYGAVNMKLALALTTTGWIFWIAVACIPLLPIEPFQDVFSRIGIGTCDKTRAPDILLYHAVKNVLQSFVKLLDSSCSLTTGFSKKLLLSSSIDIWESISVANQVKLINHDFLQISYYMEQNHCSPRYFFSAPDTAKSYGLPIIAYNFFAFLYIMIAYITIGMKTSKCTTNIVQYNMSEFVDGTDAARQKENIRLQRKIFLIIATDFFCWVPVSVMAFYYFTDMYDPGVKVTCKRMLEWKQPLSVFSLVIVSVNSALNPMLYSSAPMNVLKVLMKHVRRESRQHGCADDPDLPLPHFQTSNLNQLPGISLPHPH